MEKNKKELRKKYGELFNIVAKEIHKWDPYSLLKGGAPEDEFDFEIAKICAQIKNINSPNDAAIILSKVFSNSFEKNAFDIELCIPTGKNIYEALKNNGYLNHNE